MRCVSHLLRESVPDGPTDLRTDGRTDGPTDGRTNPLTEMRGRILKESNHFAQEVGVEAAEVEQKLTVYASLVD